MPTRTVSAPPQWPQDDNISGRKVRHDDEGPPRQGGPFA